MNTVGMSYEILDRMERAVEKVRERLLRAAAALNKIGVAYAVVGGNAVASWVSTIDEGAVRNTPDVDILVRRDDLPAITAILQEAGFVPDVRQDVVMFRDGVEGKPREAVFLRFSGERMSPDDLLPAPEIETVDDPANFRVIKLESLVQMKLTLNRLQDKVHIRDLVDVGLVDASWLPKLPAELAARLKHILDTPDS